MKTLNKCCKKNPGVCIPMTWGNIQIDPELKPSVECDICGRTVYGENCDQAIDNWNAFDCEAVA